MEGLRPRRGDPARLRRRHPRRTCCSARAAGGATGSRPCAARPSCSPPRAGVREGGRHGRALGAGPGPDGATNPALEGVAGRRLAGRPARHAGRAGRSRAAAELVDGAAPHPLDPELCSTADDRSAYEQWVRDADLLLRERARHASPTVDVPLPSHLSVSRWSRCAAIRRSWPGGCAARCPRRPRPRPAAAPPSTPGSRSGSAPRSWSTSTSCPVPATSSPPPTSALAELQEAFLASEWADRQPVEVEVPFETPLGR